MELFTNLERARGLPLGVLDALWEQESGRGRNMLNPTSQAAGHFQLIPANYRAAGIDPNNLEQSAAWTADYAADAVQRFPDLDPVDAIAMHHFGGPNTGIWGPKTQKYRDDIRSKMSRANAQAMSAQEPQEPPPMQDPQRLSTMATINAMNQSMAGGGQPQQQQPGMLQDPMFWLQAAGAMDPNQQNPMAALSRGLGAASGAYQQRTQMSPYERAKIQAMRDEAAMRQGISPLDQAKLEMQRRKDAQAQAARENAAARQAEADARAREKYEYEVASRGKGSIPGGAVREGDRILHLPGSAKEIDFKKSVANTNMLLNNVDRFMGMIEERGADYTGADAAEMANLYGDIQTGIRLAQEMGAPQAGEIAMLREQLPDPTTLMANVNPMFKSKARGAYSELIKRTKQILNLDKQRYLSNVKGGSLDFLDEASDADEEEDAGWKIELEPGGA